MGRSGRARQLGFTAAGAFFFRSEIMPAPSSAALASFYMREPVAGATAISKRLEANYPASD